MKFLALFCLVGFAAASGLHGGFGSNGLNGQMEQQQMQQQQQQQLQGQQLVDNKLTWLPGTEYTFDYQGRLLTGIPQIQSQFAGLGIQCQVRVAVSRSRYSPLDKVFTVKIENPQYTTVNQKLHQDPKHQPQESAQQGQVNWRFAQLPQVTPVTGRAAQELQQPASFVLRQDGEFQQIAVSPQEGQWSVNFKKAVAVLFQTKSINIENGVHTNKINSEDSMSYWQTTEQGLDGICQVDYQISELPMQRARQMPRYFSQQCREQMSNGQTRAYLITKTRNLDSCQQRATYNFYNPGFFRCANPSKDGSGNCEGQWTRSSITRYYTCGSSMDQLQIQTIQNEGELHQDLLGENTERFTTGSSQFLKLVSKRPAQLQSVIDSGKQIKNLTIVHEIEGMQSELENGVQGASSYGILSGDIQTLKQEIKKLINEIVFHDLTETSQKTTKNEVNMKILALAHTFAKLSQQDIASIYNDLKNQHQNDKENYYTVQTIVFDTVLMGGSVQNIRFVKQMAQNNELTTGQLISFFLNVPRYLENPQEIILEEIYQLIRSNQVQEKPLVYNQAVLSFSSLIQRGCLSHQRNSSYPVYTSGQMCNYNSQIVSDKWIPFLKSQLESSSVPQFIKTEWTNLHLVALGQMRHASVIPTILEYIEMQERPQGQSTPKTEVQARRMTRMIAVYSLSVCGQAQSHKVIEVLSAILKNQGESTEVRIAAFNILIKMNPDMYVLQSVAAMTWRESNKEVLNVINSALFSLGYQKENPIFGTEGSSMRRKAYLILPLLKRSRQLNSGTTITGDRLGLLGVSYSTINSWVSTDGNSYGFIPSHYYNKLTYLMNQYQYTAYEQGYKVKGADNLIQQLVEILVPSAQKTTKQQVGQNILNQLSGEWKQVVQKLNIKNRDYEGALGAFFLNMFETTPMFHNFQSKNSQELRQKIQYVFKTEPQTYLKSFCGKNRVNIVRLMDLVPNRHIVPTELGFPVRIDMNSPMAMILKGDIEVICNGAGAEVFPKIKTNVRVLSSSQFSAYVKVYTPFTKEYLVAGVDTQSHIDFPLALQFEYQPQEQEVKLSVFSKQSQNQQEYDIFYHHVRPFTVKAQTTDLKPYSQQSTFKPIHSAQEPQMPKTDAGLIKNIEYQFGERYGLHFQYTMESENRFAGFTTLVRKMQMFNYNPLNIPRFYFEAVGVSGRGYPSLRHHRMHLAYKPQQSQTTEIGFSFKYGYASRVQGQPIQYTYWQKADQAQQTSQYEYPQWRQYIQLGQETQQIQHVQRHPQRRQRLQQLFQQEGVQDGRAVVVETAAVFKTGSGRGQQAYKGEISLVRGSQTNSLKQQWNAQFVANKASQNEWRYCVNGYVQPQTQLPSLDIETIRQHRIQYQFENQIGFGTGNQCGNQGKFTVRGNAQVSQQQVEFSRQSQEGQEYQRLHQQNATLAQVSKVAAVVRQQASALDQIQFEVDIQNMQKTTRYNNMLLSLVKSLWWPYNETYTQTGLQENLQQGNVKNQWNLRFNSQDNTFSANLTQPQGQTYFRPAQLPYLATYVVPFSGLNRAEQLKAQSAPTTRHVQCQVAGGILKTWEKAILPFQIDDCYHLIAADCSYRKSFSVLARGQQGQRSTTQGPQEVQVLVGQTTIQIIQQQPGQQQLTVKVNQTQQVQLPSQPNQPQYIKDHKGDLIAIVYQTAERAVEVSAAFEPITHQPFLTVKFVPGQNGQRNQVQVLADNSYYGRLCGVCGELNGDQVYDLRGPRQCSYSKPQVYVASYRVGQLQGQQHQCQGLDQQVQQLLQKEQQQCLQHSVIESKVLKSYQKNLGGQCLRHIHQVLEKPNEICISRFPVTDCVNEDFIDHFGQSPLKCKRTSQTQKQVTFACFNDQEPKAVNFRTMAIRGQYIKELERYPVATQTTQQLPRACQQV